MASPYTCVGSLTPSMRETERTTGTRDQGLSDHLALSALGEFSSHPTFPHETPLFLLLCGDGPLASCYPLQNPWVAPWCVMW